MRAVGAASVTMGESCPERSVVDRGPVGSSAVGVVAGVVAAEPAGEILPGGHPTRGGDRLDVGVVGGQLQQEPVGITGVERAAVAVLEDERPGRLEAGCGEPV